VLIPNKPVNIGNKGCLKLGQFKTIRPKLPDRMKMNSEAEIFENFFSIMIIYKTTKISM